METFGKNILLAGELIADRWKIGEKIGEGTFSQIYSAYSIEDGSRVAVKVEAPSSLKPVLEWESLILKSLQDCPHVCRYYYHGKHAESTVLVMELLGESMSMLRQTPEAMHGVPIARCVSVGLEMLDCIEAFHRHGYVHRDVKASNFALSRADKPSRPQRYYIIDFGLSRQHLDENKKAIPARSSAEFRGTSMYASLSSHRRQELGPKDDLWSWFYLVMDFLRGELPWAADAQLKNRAVVLGLKEYYTEQKPGLLVEGLQGAPHLLEIMKYLQSLKYEDFPDYKRLALLLQKVLSDASDEDEGEQDPQQQVVEEIEQVDATKVAAECNDLASDHERAILWAKRADDALDAAVSQSVIDGLLEVAAQYDTFFCLPDVEPADRLRIQEAVFKLEQKKRAAVNVFAPPPIQSFVKRRLTEQKSRSDALRRRRERDLQVRRALELQNAFRSSSTAPHLSESPSDNASTGTPTLGTPKLGGTPVRNGAVRSDSSMEVSDTEEAPSRPAASASTVVAPPSTQSALPGPPSRPPPSTQSAPTGPPTRPVPSTHSVPPGPSTRPPPPMPGMRVAAPWNPASPRPPIPSAGVRGNGAGGIVPPMPPAFIQLNRGPPPPPGPGKFLPGRGIPPPPPPHVSRGRSDSTGAERYIQGNRDKVERGSGDGEPRYRRDEQRERDDSGRRRVDDVRSSEARRSTRDYESRGYSSHQTSYDDGRKVSDSAPRHRTSQDAGDYYRREWDEGNRSDRHSASTHKDRNDAYDAEHRRSRNGDHDVERRGDRGGEYDADHRRDYNADYDKERRGDRSQDYQRERRGDREDDYDKERRGARTDDYDRERRVGRSEDFGKERRGNRNDEYDKERRVDRSEDYYRERQGNRDDSYSKERRESRDDGYSKERRESHGDGYDQERRESRGDGHARERRESRDDGYDKESRADRTGGYDRERRVDRKEDYDRERRDDRGEPEYARERPVDRSDDYGRGHRVDRSEGYGSERRVDRTDAYTQGPRGDRSDAYAREYRERQDTRKRSRSVSANRGRHHRHRSYSKSDASSSSSSSSRSRSRSISQSPSRSKSASRPRKSASRTGRSSSREREYKGDSRSRSSRRRSERSPSSSRSPSRARSSHHRHSSHHRDAHHDERKKQRSGSPASPSDRSSSRREYRR